MARRVGADSKLVTEGLRLETSAHIASPDAVAQVLTTGHHELLRATAPIMLVISLIGISALFLFHGDTTARWLYAITLALVFVARVATRIVASRVSGAAGRALLPINVTTAVAFLGMTWYFGVVSPVVMVCVHHTFTSSLNYPRIGGVVWLIEALGRVVMVALLLGGVVADVGLVRATGFTATQLVLTEVLVQSILLLSYVSGRIAYTQTRSRVGAQLDLTRTTAKRELAIAQQIQRALLPPELEVPGYEISTVMHTAAEVGGDYYDVRPTNDGCWIGIGDVSGHGLSSGLVMMMVQTTVASLTLDDTHTVDQVVDRANRVVYDNVRHRLKGSDYVTFALTRLHRDGRLSLAGRHEPSLLWRAATRRCELLDPDGVWLGIKRSILESTQIATRTLAPGDVLVLYTDGITEASGATGRYGLERLQAAVETHAGVDVNAATLRRHLEREVTAFSPRFTDDAALVVVRYVG